MSEFSNLLAALTKSKNIKIYSMVQYCNLDRSTMYKIINGKRNPSSFELVQRMADFMCLTPAESKEFFKAYHISLVGRETYYRRENIYKFIVDFSNICSPQNVPSMMDIGDTFSLIHKNVIALNGKTNINNAIYQILHLEAKKTQGQIQILAQPEYTFLIDLLAAISKVNHSLEIQHILCLNNTDTVTSSLQNYNVLCLKNIMPMCECPCQYTSHYYYNNIHSLIGTLNVLPHLVLTTDYAVTFSPDLKYGVFYQDKETILMFHNLFFDYLAQTSPLIRKTELVLEQCEQFSSMNLGETPGFSFQSEPCLIPLIPVPFLEKYVRLDLPNRELTIQRLAAYIKMQYDKMYSGNTRFIFSKQGVINFMTTGILSEIPPNLCLAFDLSDRIILINRLLDTCMNGNHYLLSGDIEMLNNSLCIYTSAQSGYLLFQNSFGELTNLVFEEPSILHAFYDFMENLDTGNMLASQDELLRFLKSVISHFRLKYKL